MVLPLKGNAVAKAMLRLIGWRVVCPAMPAKQGVMIAWPHTSNWDFPVAMLARAACGLPLTWWAKESLFRWPLFGTWIRWLGARPLTRNRGPQGYVGLMVEELQAAKAEDRFLWMGLSPEGTRARTEGWRSGFYRIALQARPPRGAAGARLAPERRPRGRPGRHGRRVRRHARMPTSQGRTGAAAGEVSR